MSIWTPPDTSKGKRLYELIGDVMRKRFGPGGRADNLPWEKMDGEFKDHIPSDYMPSEKEAWQEIAERFIEHEQAN
jgi:hypothetical protein